MKVLLALSIILVFTPVYAADYCPLPESMRVTENPKADVPFDLDTLKSIWRQRIATVLKAGKLPIIDIESSFSTGKVNAADYARRMDENGIALTAFSSQIGRKKRGPSGTSSATCPRRSGKLSPTKWPGSYFLTNSSNSPKFQWVGPLNGSCDAVCILPCLP